MPDTSPTSVRICTVVFGACITADVAAICGVIVAPTATGWPVAITAGIAAAIGGAIGWRISEHL